MNQSTEQFLHNLFASAEVPRNESKRQWLRAHLLQQAQLTPRPQAKPITRSSTKLFWLAVPAISFAILAFVLYPNTQAPNVQLANVQTTHALQAQAALAESINNTFSGKGIHKVITTTVRTDEGYGEQYDGTYNSVRTEYVISPNAMLRSMRETYGDLVIDEYKNAFNAQLELFTTNPDTSTVENCFLSVSTSRAGQSNDELLENQKFLRAGIDAGDYCGVNTTEQATSLFYNSGQQIDVQNPQVIVEPENYWQSYIQFTTEQPIQYESIVILSTDSYSYDQDWKDPEDVNQNAIVYTAGDSALGTQGVISNQLQDGRYLQKIPFHLATSSDVAAENPVESYTTTNLQLQFALLDQPLSDLWQVQGNDLADHVQAVYPVFGITLDIDTKTYSVNTIAGEAAINELNAQRQNAVEAQVAKLTNSSELFRKIAGGNKLLELLTDQQQVRQSEEGGSVVITATNEFGKGDSHVIETITVYIDKATEKLQKVVHHSQYPDGANVYTTTFDTIEELDDSAKDMLTRDYWNNLATKLVDELPK